MVAVVAAVLLLPALRSAAPPQAPVVAAAAAAPVPARYVGAAACSACHAAQFDAWRTSQHARAMQPATRDTVLGDFSGVRFAAKGEVTTFDRRDDRYTARTTGPDGKVGTFDVRFTFGVEPLQQYLVELPGGRLQALGVAWDARPKALGGQRWFHLYPDRVPHAGDPLHWTGLDQTWNYQCADCHSTNLRKNYDAATGTYATTWSEINVACEACHGPASNHIAWAKREGDWQALAADKGLLQTLDERRGVTWKPVAGAATSQRSASRTTSREIDTCARCHARRGQYSDALAPGEPFLDAYRPARLDPGLYHPDGQQRDEVYDHASFLQSRMHAHGVTCADCHDPHTQKLRAPGNAVCAQCHAPAQFDATSHHHHAPGTSGAQCAACHMPTTTYMVVDPRHDHSLRIPRPDRSVSLGVPNACNGCHAAKSARWAADAVKGWYPNPLPGFQSFAEAFVAGERGAPGAATALAAIVRDLAQPPIVRATAIGRLGALSATAAPAEIRAALTDPDATVRAAAVEALGHLPPGARVEMLGPLLADSSRLVRIEAARALAGAPERDLGGRRAAFDRALAEYVAALQFNADRPEAQASLGNLYASRGDGDAAVAAYRKAIALDPTFVEASINLADLHRARGLESLAEETLRAALARNPPSAAVHHALGLSLVRQKRAVEALAELATAAKLAPAQARLAYVYAVALHDTGRRAEALAVIDAALARNAYDRDLLFAQANYARESGDAARLTRAVGRLKELAADDPQAASALAGSAESPR